MLTSFRPFCVHHEQYNLMMISHMASRLFADTHEMCLPKSSGSRWGWNNENTNEHLFQWHLTLWPDSISVTCCEKINRVRWTGFEDRFITWYHRAFLRAETVLCCRRMNVVSVPLQIAMPHTINYYYIIFCCCTAQKHVKGTSLHRPHINRIRRDNLCSWWILHLCFNPWDVLGRMVWDLNHICQETTYKANDGQQSTRLLL